MCFSAASQGAAHGSPPSPTRAAGLQLALVITGLREANGAQEASGWAPLLAHTHTHTRFCFPQTRTKVEAKSGGSPCAAQVWEHARMQRVCPDQFVTLKLGILSGLPPQHHFLLKKGVGLGHWAWQTQKGQVLPLLESCRSSRNTREHLRYRQQPWKTAELTREAANRNSGGYLIKTSHTAR